MSVKRVLANTAKVAAVLVVALAAAVLVAQRFSDGPMGPISGGPLRAGELVSERDVDWSFLGGGGEIELQLVEPPGSRTTGALVHDGQLFVPCDLGFMWRRISRAPLRWMLAGIYSVKRWHEDALHDGRVVLRVSGKRYERQAVRVTDPELLATLRSRLEDGAKRYFGPDGLSDVPADPEAIWFFRMDPRPEAVAPGPS